MKTYAKNYAVLSTRAGKQLRTRLRVPTAWFGTAEIVREHQNPDGPQTVVTHFCTPYFASVDEARQALFASVNEALVVCWRENNGEAL